MGDTTNISDLPPAQTNNITLEMKESSGKPTMIPSQSQAPPPQGPVVPRQIPHNTGSPQQFPAPQQMPAGDIGKIVSGIKSASAANMTTLPSRDIPMMTHPHTQDNQSRPNYVPPPPPNHTDYIKQHDNIQQIIQREHKERVKEDRMDQIYEELQTPVFVMVLYLLFQLPFFQKMLYRQLPSLFSRDGHTHLGGYLFKTILFGGSFYFIQKGIKYLSRR